MPDILEEDGAAYVSLKSGIKTREDEEGRYFTDVPKEWIHGILKKNSGLAIADEWISADRMGRNDFQWLNLVLRKTEPAN